MILADFIKIETLIKKLSQAENFHRNTSEYFIKLLQILWLRQFHNDLSEDC